MGLVPVGAAVVLAAGVAAQLLHTGPEAFADARPVAVGADHGPNLAYASQVTFWNN